MTRKHLAVIGSTGMLGSDLVLFLRERFHVTGIQRADYQAHVGKTFDIIVNANGNSRRFWANAHPVEDFIASTESVYKSVVDFTCGIYVYISSSDVYDNHTSPRHTKENVSIHLDKLSPYGFHKYVSEMLVRKYAKNYLILRSSMILGTHLKKGPFYDIAHRMPLFITKDSRLQLITTREIANIITFLLNKRIYGHVLNVGGRGAFSFRDIETYVHVPVTYARNGQRQEYEMNVAKLHKLFSLKTSREYLREFLRGL